MKTPKWEMVYILLNPEDPDFEAAIRWAKKYFRKPLRPQTSMGLSVIMELSRLRALWKVNRPQAVQALLTLRRFIKREGYVRIVSRTQSKYRGKVLPKRIENYIVEAFANSFHRALLRKAE